MEGLDQSCRRERLEVELAAHLRYVPTAQMLGSQTWHVPAESPFRHPARKRPGAARRGGGTVSGAVQEKQPPLRERVCGTHRIQWSCCRPHRFCHCCSRSPRSRSGSSPASHSQRPCSSRTLRASATLSPMRRSPNERRRHKIQKTRNLPESSSPGTKSKIHSARALRVQTARRMMKRHTPPRRAACSMHLKGGKPQTKASI